MRQVAAEPLSIINLEFGRKKNAKREANVKNGGDETRILLEDAAAPTHPAGFLPFIHPSRRWRSCSPYRSLVHLASILIAGLSYGAMVLPHTRRMMKIA